MGQVERVVETRGEKFGRKEEKVKSGLAKWFFPPTGALQLVKQMKKSLKMSPIRLEKLTQFLLKSASPLANISQKRRKKVVSSDRMSIGVTSFCVTYNRHS